MSKLGLIAYEWNVNGTKPRFHNEVVSNSEIEIKGVDAKNLIQRVFFAQFIIMQGKQILARAMEIQKENWG